MYLVVFIILKIHSFRVSTTFNHRVVIVRQTGTLSIHVCGLACHLPLPQWDPDSIGDRDACYGEYWRASSGQNNVRTPPRPVASLFSFHSDLSTLVSVLS